MAKIRNPLAGFALTILWALGLAALVTFASTFIPYLEFRLFFLGFALFGAGVLAGRQSYLASLGFVGSYLGGFVGMYLIQIFFWWNPWLYLMTTLLSVACALGGAMTGKLGLRRLDRATEEAPKVRRCPRCGSRVGPTARRCWDCRAFLSF
jgi:hypothetical protein